MGGVWLENVKLFYERGERTAVVYTFDVFGREFYIIYSFHA